MDSDLLRMINSHVDEINSLCESEDSDALYDYLDGVLDVEFHVGADMSFRGAELLITFGGPNIYIVINSAGYAKVEGYWGGEHYDRGLDSTASDMLYDYVSQWYDSIRM